MRRPILSFVLTLLTALALPATSVWAHVFQPDDLHAIVRDSIAERDSQQLSLKEQLNVLQDKLADRYPGRITKNGQWVFNQTGGALGQLQILYCSLSEYLIFFGSSIGTEGHSGRYDMEVWDAMIKGEMWTALQGELERETFKDGDMAYLPRGKAKAYKIPEYGYMLEYGRGNILKAFDNGILTPAFFINQDFESMLKQLKQCGGSAIKSLFMSKERMMRE